MTNHYVATVPVKFTDNDGQERTRFQRVGAMFRNTRNGDGTLPGGPFPVPGKAAPGRSPLPSVGVFG